MKGINTRHFNYNRIEDVVSASGENWEYKQVGVLTEFTQTGKIPSLRVIKTLVKLLNNKGERV
tara:strand:- start:1664 stop:1852 length:189 start_codon:yes stop_codon:yes gene_type:complete